MTDEEILKDYCEKECKDFLQCGFSNKEHCPFHKGIKYGLAESKAREQALGERVLQLEKDKGKLIDENRELKEQNEELKCCENCYNFKKGKCKEDNMFWARVDKLQGKTCKGWK